MKGDRSGHNSGLTTREEEVWSLLAQGYNNQAIADRMVISRKSVENYINALRDAEGPSDPEMSPRVALALKHWMRDAWLDG